MSGPHVLVLAGGLSYERDVSLRSGRRAVDALRRSGAEVSTADVDSTLLARVQADRPDAIVVALHGATGEDGALRGVLDLIGVPFVGSDSSACRVAWDKPAAKAVLSSAGLPTPAWVALPHETFRELGAQPVLDRIVHALGLPLMAKPARGGSGLGAQAVRSMEQLPTAMVGCFAYDETALLERFVSGTDLAVSVLDLGDGPFALPPVEIVPPDGLYDYTARYTAGTTTYHVPARMPDEVRAEAERVAVAAHLALGLRDLSRVDLIVDAAGEVHVLEVNVSPGLTETSLLPMAVQAADLDLGAVLLDLVHRTIDRRSRAMPVPVGT
jgi:D-alanine-D-alanine ligase